MKAYNANATFLSNVYEQEVGDTNWSEYQVVMTGGQNKLNIRSSDTTSTNLSILNDDRITTNTPIMLSVDGSNVVSGVAGAVTIGTVKTGTSNGTILTAKSSSNSPLQALYAANNTYSPRGYKLRYDGKYFWAVRTDGTLMEFVLSTPDDFTTASSTGKSMSGFSSVSFDISFDGRFLYKWSNTTNYQIIRYTLSTPWDISSVNSSLTVTQTYAAGPTTATTFVRISKDGTWLVVGNASTVWGYQLTRPWDITSTSSYAYTTSIPNLQLECSPDGKLWLYTTHVSSSSVKLSVAVAATAWDVSTLGTPVTITCTDGTFTYLYSYSASSAPFPVLHGNGTFTLLPCMQSTNSAYQKHSTWDADIALSRNINISSFGLASAPTSAWLKLPSVSVATANAAGRISSFAKELHLDTGTAATTTVAVVGADTANTLATGDTVLLNGTTSVTLSNVVEVSNGLAKQDPGNTTDYIQYNNKSFNTSISNGFVRFSRDGSKMYVAGTGSNGAGIYLYTLSTPNDVTTATWDNKNYVLFSGINNGSQTTFSGFDIHPDGNSLIVFLSSGDGSYAATIDVRMFTMSRKHDLLSMTFTTNKTISHSDGNYAAHPRFGRFNKNGTQVYFSVTTYNVNYSIYMYYMTLTTPYDLATAGSTSNLFSQTSSGYQYGYTDGCFSPDGTFYVSGGLSAVDGWLFTKTPTTANLLTSVPFGALNNDQTMAINWPAASGITTSTAITGFDFAWDSTKFYVMNSTGTIYQFNVRVKALNKYTITYPTQASAPTSVYLPDRSTQLSLTTSVSNGNIVQTSAYTSTNSRAVQFKLTNNPIDCEVTQVRLNLRKT